MIDVPFCELLEYKISTTLQNSNDKTLKKYWCDGVMLPSIEHEYSVKHVNEKRKITLTGFIGVDGQDQYEIVVHFGLDNCNKKLTITLS